MHKTHGSVIALILFSSFTETSFHFHLYLKLCTISNYISIQAHLIWICQHDYYLSFALFLYFFYFFARYGLWLPDLEVLTDCNFWHHFQNFLTTERCETFSPCTTFLMFFPSEQLLKALTVQYCWIKTQTTNTLANLEILATTPGERALLNLFCWGSHNYGLYEPYS